MVVESMPEIREYFRLIFERSPLGLEIYDAEGRLVDANRACLEIFGVDRLDDVRGIMLFEDPNISDEMKQRLKKGQFAEYEAPFDFEKIKASRLYPTKKSGNIYLNVLITPIILSEKNLRGGYLVQLRDVTEKKVAEGKIRQQEAFLESVIESISNPFYVIDVNDYSVKLANNAACFGPLSGMSKCYALTHKRGKPCESSGMHPCPLEEVKKNKRSYVTEHVHYDKDGNARYYEVHGHPIFDKEGNVVQMIEYNLDITERKRLYAISIVDELTSLYNRRGFFELAEKQLAIALRNDMIGLLVFMDIDNLKEINDTFGHKEGDNALVDVRDILRYTFRESDIIARIGGDEFVVFTQEKYKGAADTILFRLDRKIDEYNRGGRRPYTLSVSIGYDHCSAERRCSLKQLIENADKKMYAQKMGKKHARARV